MSSTFVLISLLLSLSMAVLVPELKDSKKPIFSLSPEYDYMVNKQRKGFLSIGLLAVSTFFVSIQTLSVSLFVLHLFLDLLFWSIRLHFFSSKENYFTSEFTSWF